MLCLFVINKVQGKAVYSIFKNIVELHRVYSGLRDQGIAPSTFLILATNAFLRSHKGNPLSNFSLFFGALF